MPQVVPADVELILAAHSGREGALLPILHDVQAALGYLPDAARTRIAEALNLGRAEVIGVVSFYHDFRTEPPGRAVLKLCRAEACQARGGEALAAQAEADGRVETRAVYCLGLCASGPAAMVGERVVARLDATRLDQLIAEIAA